MARLMPPGAMRPAANVPDHTYWIFPVLADDPAHVVTTLAGAGFDATQLSSLRVVEPSVATNPTNITAVVSGTQYDLSWPASHLGWILQSNSVSVANSAAWFPVANSTATNRVRWESFERKSSRSSVPSSAWNRT